MSPFFRPSPPRIAPCSMPRRRLPWLRPLAAVAFAAAALGASGCASTPVPPPAVVAMPVAAPPMPTQDLPPGCATPYAALPDLADLARRYGEASSVFFDALGDVGDQLERCVEQAGELRYRQTLTPAAYGPRAGQVVLPGNGGPPFVGS